MRATAAVVALFLLASVTGCAKDLVTGRKTLNYYSLDAEPRLGQQVLAGQIKEAKKKARKMNAESDATEFKRLVKIVEAIRPHTHYPKFPYEIHLMESDIVNAWCAPGGKMMVYTGLWHPEKGLVERGNENQLAAVIAHEMAHANARHVTESISRNMTIMLAGAAVQTAIAAGGSTQGANLFGQVFSDGMNIFVPSYSRSNEYEADRIGLFYMAAAGYDPREAVELWKKAAKRRKDITSIYASHPASGSRAKALEALLPEAMIIYGEAVAQGRGPKPASTKKTRNK